MLQHLFDCYPFAGVEFKHFANQVKTTRVDFVAKELRSVYLLSGIEKLKKGLVKIDGHAFKFCRRRCSSPRHNFFDLVDRGRSWKQGLSVEHLAYQASKCPNIDFFVVILAAK